MISEVFGPKLRLKRIKRFGPKLNNQSFCDSKNPDYMQRRSKRGALFGSFIFIFLLPYKCHSELLTFAG